MTRLHDRLDAAIRRAAKRYFSTFYFQSGRGLRKKIVAVKRVADADSSPVLSGSASVRLVEFVVSRKTHEDALRVAGFGNGGETTFDLLRKSAVVESIDGEERVYAFAPQLPYSENSPDSGTVRWFCYWKQQNS